MERKTFPLVAAYHRKEVLEKQRLKFKQIRKGNSSGLSLIVKQPVNITPDMSILEIVEEVLPPDWQPIFEKAGNELHKVDAKLKEDPIFFPLKRDIFKVFELCPLSKVKVVILGQDPYPSLDADGLPVAQGLSFSVRKSSSVPRSLQNIYKNLEDFVPGFKRPNHGDLTEWVKQGVFLLNTSLTVRPGVPDSHKKLWIGLIKPVINAILDSNPDTIFLLWGRKAQEMKDTIKNRGHIFETSHPSPQGVNRGFSKSDHFVKVNTKLEALNKTPINWNLSDV